jgi:heme exporter protein A
MIEPRAAIRAGQLSKSFGGRIVLDAVDLEIAPGQSVALTGANGAGKTTLLACLASVLRPDGGEVHWFGRLAGCNPAMHRSIGLLTHESALYPHLTLRENLLFAARMSRAEHPRRRADRWLEATGLAPHADCLPTRLSRGMRQRLDIARCLVHDPPLMLLDEPFTHLDAAGTQWLAGLLVELRTGGQTLCFVTHDRQMVALLATRVLELRRGKVFDVTDGKGDRRLLGDDQRCASAPDGGPFPQKAPVPLSATRAA